MKCIIVGTGFGSVHATWLHALADVKIDTLIYRSNKSKASTIRSEYDIPNISTDLAQTLQTDQFDLLSIVSPPDSHADYLRLGVAAGIPVVIDKPLAQSLEDAEVVHALAEGHRQDVYVFFQWRLHSAVLRLKELVTSGVLGRLTHFAAAFDHDFLAKNETQWPWRHQYDSAGGGSLGDMGVHLFDLLRFITSQEWVVTGAATGLAHPKRMAKQGSIQCVADDFAHVKLKADQGETTGNRPDQSRHHQDQRKGDGDGLAVPEQVSHGGAFTGAVG